MAKALQGIGTAIAFVGAVALTGGAALMGGFAGATTLFGISAQTLVGVGSLVSSIGGALPQPKVGAGGSPSTWTADPNAPLHFAAGRIGVAGQIVYRAAYGPNDRMYQSLISVVSAAGPIDGWESFKADDIAVTFDGSGKANSSYYANVMWRQTRLGAQPDTALTSPSGLEGGATLPSWGSSYKLSGKASYILTLAENSKRSAYQGREPQPINVFRGLKVYDPRLDSTYPGGSGAHRLNNPATWTYSNNPILWGLKWSLGLWEDTTGKGAPQVGQQVGGIGAPVDSVDVASFIEAANIADANGWTTAAWPSTDDDKAQVLDAFLQAGGAYYIERAGKIACLHRAAPRASVATISAQDTAGPLEIDTTASRIQRKNAIVPSIWSEADGWQITAIEEVTAPEWVAEDGGRKRSEGVTFPYVTDASQAAQLACLQIAHTREGISGRIPLKPYMQGIEPGDCFTITETGFVLNGLKCLCLETSYDAATGVHTVTFVSETDGKYPYARGQTQTPPAPPALEAVDPTYVTPPLPGDWTVVPRPPAPGGSQLPGFDLGGLVSNETADSVIVEHGPSSTGPWRPAYEGPPDATSIPIDGLQPGATYYVAVRYRRGNNYSERYVYGPYTAPSLIGDVMPDAPGLSQIKANIETAFGDIFDVSELIGDTRAELEAADAALGSAIGSLDSRADTLETQTASLEANKASVLSLNAQIARIDDAEAVNASQALALVDLENGKVALSEYNTLKGEVTAARDGAPSLLGQIQNLKSVDLDLQTNKASVESVNALTGRTLATEAGIIDLEIAQANETSARVQAVNQLTARQNINPNLFPGGSGELGVAGWGGSGGLLVGNYPNVGPSYFYKPFPVGVAVDDYQVSPRVRVEGISTLTVQWSGFAYLGASTEVWVAWYDAGGNYVAETPHAPLNSGSPQTFTRPEAALFAEWVVRTFGPAPTGYADVAFFGIKFERGSVATIYTNDATQTGLAASVTEQSLAIIDLENNAAIAAWRVKAEASGARPAIIEAVSSTLGSYLAFSASQIFFGENTAFIDDLDIWITTVGSNVRILGFGAPFGAANNLLEWWGPATVPLGSMTTTNGLNGRMTTAPYVFDNTIGSILTATTNIRSSAKTRATPGSTSSDAVTVTAAGGSGSYSYQWGYFAGDTSATCSAPTSPTMALTLTVATGETKGTTWLCVITDTSTGKSTTVTFRYSLSQTS